MPEWWQWFFDLTANQKVRLTIEGDVGEMRGELQTGEYGKWTVIAATFDQYALDEVMDQLMEQAKAREEEA